MINGSARACSLGSLCAVITGGCEEAAPDQLDNIYEKDFFPGSHWITIYKTEANFDLLLSFYQVLA